MRARIVTGMAALLGVLVLMGCDLIPVTPVTPPEVSPAVTASIGEFETSIRLSWAPVERAETYRIFRADARDWTYTYIGETPNTAYTDDVGTANTARWYWYVVRACNAAGCGPESVPVRGYAGAPPAPTGVRATDGGRGEPRDHIEITWEPVPGATSYEVVRDRVRDGDYATTVATKVPEPPVIDGNVRFGMTYWYRVRARNRWGFGPLSEPDSGCTPPCFPSP